MQVAHIIFDLDGTLIDSSDSILKSFRFAFDQCRVEPLYPLTDDIIGPPLMETLAALAGTKDTTTLNILATAFKKHYDETGYRGTTVFQGVEEMLTTLCNEQIPLSIATNKRLAPTQKILHHLNWTKYFPSVHALDSFNPPLANKIELLCQAITANMLNPVRSYYIGDRREDGVAANANNLNFIMATWGYGTSLCAGDGMRSWLPMHSPDNVVKHFQSLP